MSIQNQQPADNGFVLPPPTTEPAPPATTTAQEAALPVTINLGQSSTSSRDMLIGGAILLVLLVAFLFARIGYANHLVSKRVSPSKANAAGWWLFIALFALSLGVVLASVNPIKFLAPLILAPLGGISLSAFVLMLLSSRR